MSLRNEIGHWIKVPFYCDIHFGDVPATGDWPRCFLGSPSADKSDILYTKTLPNKDIDNAPIGADRTQLGLLTLYILLVAFQL